MKFKQLVILASVLLISACEIGKESTAADPGPIISECGSSGTPEFDITNVDLQVLQAPEPKTYAKMANGFIFDIDMDAQYSDVVFSLESVTQNIAKNREMQNGVGKGNTLLDTLSFTFFNSAYACSPLPPSTKEKIINIKITSSAPFNDEFAANQSLASKFDVVYIDAPDDFYSYVNGGIEYYSVESYVAQPDVKAGNIIQLKLNEEPQYSGNHIFFIEMTLDTGEIFTMESPELSLITAADKALN